MADETKKPKTFEEVVASRGDTIASTVERKPTVTISGCGLQGTGKTIWGLRYMPPPILHLNFDRESAGLYYVKGKDGKLLVPKDRADQIVRVQLAPEDFKEDQMSWTELTARFAREKLEGALRDYIPVMDGGTVMIDGGAVFNNLVQAIELAEIRRTREAKDQKLFPFDYAKVNSYWSGMLGMLDRAHVNFYITHHLAEDWGADGPIGTFHAQNNSQVPRMIQVELWFWCQCGQVMNAEAIATAKKKKEKEPSSVYCRKIDCQLPGHQGSVFQVRIRENKLNKQVRGLTVDELPFETLYQLSVGQPYSQAPAKEKPSVKSKQ